MSMNPHLLAPIRPVQMGREILAALLGAVCSALLLGACSSATASPPLAPIGLSAVAGDHAVSLSWESVGGATGYEVEYGMASAGPVGSGSLRVDAGAALLLTVSGLVDGTTYRFAVAARRLATQGALSTEVMATPHGATTFAVLSTSPAAGATGVPLSAQLRVTFNQAAGVASLTSSGCSSTLRLIAQGHQNCVALTAPPTTSDNVTFSVTPSTALAPNTHYQFAITTDALSSSGAPLPAPVVADFTTGSGADTTPPAEVSSLSLVPALQSLALSWVAPADADFVSARVYACSSSTTCDPKSLPVIAEVPSSPSAAAQFSMAGLAASTNYRLLVSTVDAAGNESAGASLQAATAFSGRAFDFSSGDRASALGAASAQGNVGAWFSWNQTQLQVAMGTIDGGNLLQSNQDVLWVAIDTDPESDATGEWRTASVGSNEVIWPFKADYVVQLTPNGANTSVQLHAAAGCALILEPATATVGSHCPALEGATSFDGAAASGIDEVAIPAAAIGNPSRVRLAIAALNSTNGYAYALSPQNPGGIDVLGFFASATASFNPGANLWNASLAATAALSSVSPLNNASSLVTMSVQSAALPALKGSLHPLSYSLADVAFALRDDGTGGDAHAGDGVYSGSFNFGGATEELFFKFSLSGADEFAAGSDRVWTLSGSSESLPLLSYATSYSATHTVELAFAVSNPLGSSSNKEVLGNVAELGSFGGGTGAPLTSSGGSLWSTAAVTFANHDFTLSALQWKGHDTGSGTWETDWPSGPVQNHEMNDDVLNRRTLSWSWNDYTHDPQ